MNHLMLKMLESSIPPAVREKAKAAFEQLQATGHTEGVFDVPGVGLCKVTIERVKNES